MAGNEPEPESDMEALLERQRSPLRVELPKAEALERMAKAWERIANTVDKLLRVVVDDAQQRQNVPLGQVTSVPPETQSPELSSRRWREEEP